MSRDISATHILSLRGKWEHNIEGVTKYAVDIDALFFACREVECSCLSIRLSGSANIREDA